MMTQVFTLTVTHKKQGMSVESYHSREFVGLPLGGGGGGVGALGSSGAASAASADVKWAFALLLAACDEQEQSNKSKCSYVCPTSLCLP